MSKIYDATPFDETYILYNANDPVSFLCAVFSLIPIMVLIYYFTWFLRTAEMEPVFLAFGQVSNNIINYVIKRVFKQDRPDMLSELIYAGKEYPMLQNEYGMPSAHSQFMGFFATFCFLRVVLQNKNIKGLRNRILCGGFYYILCFATAFSRVYLMYHTVEQVIVGVLLGCLTGSCYFILVSFCRELGLIDYILSYRIFQKFYIKDSYDVEIGFEEGYRLYSERKNNRVKNSINKKSK